MDKMHATLAALGISDPAISRVTLVLDAVAWASEEIEAAAARWPAAQAAIREGAFPLLAPTDILMALSCPELVYRAHAREILDRVGQGLDTRPGTDAECVAALSLGSMKAPLNHDHCVAMGQLFEKLWPERARPILAGAYTSPSYPGVIEEILGPLRRRCGQDDRKLGIQGAAVRIRVVRTGEQTKLPEA